MAEAVSYQRANGLTLDIATVMAGHRAGHQSRQVLVAMAGTAAGHDG